MLKRTFIFQFDENGNPSYTLSTDFTPEQYAKMALRIATFLDSDLVTKEMSDNGYHDVDFRLKAGAEAATTAFFRAITGVQPIVIMPQQSEDKAESPKEGAKETGEDRPFIEALVG